MTEGDHVLVGRAAELAVADAALSGGSAGLQVLTVTGEPGIGKTRWLTEVRRRAERSGWLVAHGRASDLGRGTPFSVFAEALTPLVLGELATVSHLPTAVADALGAVLPLLRTTGTDARLAARVLLERLSHGRPLLVVLDDLHWADDDTIDLIDQLLRQGTSSRLLLAAGYRPRQVSGRLAGVLSSSAAHHIELGPLSAAQCAELLGYPVGHPVAGRMCELAEGNPRYLAALSRAGFAATQQNTRLPAEVGAALRSEADRLPADVRRVLEAAAVLGAVFEPEVLPMVAGLPPGKAWAALDMLVAVDLLRADENPARLRFRHPLIRDAVYQAIGIGCRRACHARAAHVKAHRLPGGSGGEGVGMAALSSRERQVAELVANGRTNRAIAAELFLSEKTIERHLSSAFTKLGVSSRTALAVHVLTHI